MKVINFQVNFIAKKVLINLSIASSLSLFEIRPIINDFYIGLPTLQRHLTFKPIKLVTSQAKFLNPFYRF